jgi:hypothetical protein
MSYDDVYNTRTTAITSGQSIADVHVRNLYDQLGPDPSGTGAATVRARLDALDSIVSQKAPTVHQHSPSQIVSDGTTFAPALLGTGTPTAATVLNGLGQWVLASSAIPGVYVNETGGTLPAGLPVGTLVLTPEQ